MNLWFSTPLKTYLHELPRELPFRVAGYCMRSLVLLGLLPVWLYPRACLSW